MARRDFFVDSLLRRFCSRLPFANSNPELVMTHGFRSAGVAAGESPRSPFQAQVDADKANVDQLEAQHRNAALTARSRAITC
jgi:hypothetical protein